MFVLRARIMGAGDIIVIDDAPERLARARPASARATRCRSRTRRRRSGSAACASSPGGRGADVVVDCAGVPAALPEGLELARKGATYIETGAFVDAGSVEINPHRHLCSKSIRLIGATNHAYTGYGPALKLLERHGESAGFRSIITHTDPVRARRGGDHHVAAPRGGQGARRGRLRSCERRRPPPGPPRPVRRRAARGARRGPARRHHRRTRPPARAADPARPPRRGRGARGRAGAAPLGPGGAARPGGRSTCCSRATSARSRTRWRRSPSAASCCAAAAERYSSGSGRFSPGHAPVR